MIYKLKLYHTVDVSTENTRYVYFVLYKASQIFCSYDVLLE